MNCPPFGEIENYAYCLGLHNTAEHVIILVVLAVLIFLLIVVVNK